LPSAYSKRRRGSFRRKEFKGGRREGTVARGGDGDLKCDYRKNATLRTDRGRSSPKTAEERN